MPAFEWRNVPVGPDAARWITRAASRTVLVVVHTVTFAQRLMDIVRLLGSDLRIQVVFTIAPDVFSEGVEEFLRGMGGILIPWLQATQLQFDLALAAGYGFVHELHAPLVVVPHGAGHSKLTVRQPGRRMPARSVYGLDAQRLLNDGRLVPAALVLSHQDELATLGSTCPEALPAAVVAGDPCYDLIVASAHRRPTYRRALAVDDNQKLVVVTSTWGSQSLFSRADRVLPRLLGDLPADRYRVVALLHPNVWHGHGKWQVRSWLADWLRQGLGLVPPDAEWRAALAAADWVIADHGSVGVYGTAVKVPILLTGFPERDVHPGSPSAALAETAPRLHPGRAIVPQLARAAASFRPTLYDHVAARITSQPGRFDRNMRRLMYRLLRLQAPPAAPQPPVAEPPFLLS